MSLSFLPKFMTPELTDLTPAFLQQQGIRLLMMDFDNTIVPYFVNTPTEKMDAWLRAMHDSPVQLAIVSNTKNSRLLGFCEQYDIPYVMHARKPSARGIRECMDRFSMAPDQSALVGDQIFTDTLGGNAANVTTILVHSIHNHNIWMKARHLLEIPFIFIAKGRRIKL